MPFLRRARRRSAPPGILLALDPGGTTGYALFDGGLFVQSGEAELGLADVAEFIRYHAPARIVCESYTIYGHKLAIHSGSDVPTLQLIGAIKVTAEQEEVPITMQAAHLAKGFCSDKKLREWGLYHPSSRHARDAARHGAYYLLFGKD